MFAFQSGQLTLSVQFQITYSFCLFKVTLYTKHCEMCFFRSVQVNFEGSLINNKVSIDSGQLNKYTHRLPSRKPEFDLWPATLNFSNQVKINLITTCFSYGGSHTTNNNNPKKVDIGPGRWLIIKSKHHNMCSIRKVRMLCQPSSLSSS